MELIKSFPDYSPVFLRLLVSRGLIDQEAIDRFLAPEYGGPATDPFQFRDMERAVERIIRAIQAEERIVVYGDYDADGVCGAALLVLALEQLGAKVGTYIPYRQTEGYGLNLRAVESLRSEGYTLMITNDCGVTNVNEVARANELGLDVIISDHHHEPPELPKAFAILNPNISGETYPFRGLSGTGVSFKLAHALLVRTDYGATLGRPLAQGWEKWLLDLVAIATVADMVPMLSENRTLVTYGLRVLRKTKRPGLRALFTVMGSESAGADEETIGFQIAPRLNAAGRLDHANSAFRLLVTGDEHEAAVIAADLEAKNRERQQLTERVVTEAKAQIGEPGERFALAVFNPDWPIGVLGLAAGRLVNAYNRPVLVMGESNGEVLGSGRSIPAFNIIENIERQRQYLSKFGGHAQACGFSLRKAGDREAFIRSFSAQAKEALKGVSLLPELVIDSECPLTAVNWDLLDDVNRLAPFGQGARPPVFAVLRVAILDAAAVGRDNRHLRLTVRSADGAVQRTIGFSFGSELPNLPIGRTIDIAFTLSADEWNGEQRLQLKLLDVHYAE